MWLRHSYPLRLALLLAGLAGAAASAASDKPFPGGAAAYLVEAQGRTLWSREADRTLPPASLTKIMTALLFLESGLPLDGAVTMSANVQRATGTRLRLRAGEQMRTRDVLAAMLLYSANDACLALAEHVAGSKVRFAESMNARAHALNLTQTHFTNPCGHDEPKHRSSVRDLATLTRVAMRQPVFAELVGTVDVRVSTLGGRAFHIENKNEIVGRYEGAIGVKSGFTPRAGNCLVALVERDGVSVLLVVLNAPNRWWDTTAVLDRAFEQMRSASRPGN
ncbi:MAG: D-alanyl-D-alanine carboxypeptidase family protein [Burkholderiales bacterium]